jgi:hypothetical protein
VDGACFLGVLGVALGAFVGYRGPAETPVLLYIVLGAGLLALGAALFGVSGYLLAHWGAAVVSFLFVGSILGALAGAWLDGTDGLLVGVLGGGLVGVAAAVLTRPRPPDSADPPDRES